MKTMYYDPKKISNLCPGEKQLAAMEEAVQHMSERRQRRFANFKKQVEKFWQLYPWLMCFVVCVTLMSCRSQQIIVPNDTITQTQTKTKTIARDSIYLHDSIYVREYIQGDTVFRDKLVEHWKDRWLTRIDTVMQKDTTTVTQTITQTITEPVRYVPGFYKWCVAILVLLVVGKIIMIVIKYIKI